MKPAVLIEPVSTMVALDGGGPNRVAIQGDVEAELIGRRRAVLDARIQHDGVAADAVAGTHQVDFADARNRPADRSRCTSAGRSPGTQERRRRRERPGSSCLALDQRLLVPAPVHVSTGELWVRMMSWPGVPT